MSVSNDHLFMSGEESPKIKGGKVANISDIASNATGTDKNPERYVKEADFNALASNRLNQVSCSQELEVVA